MQKEAVELLRSVRPSTGRVWGSGVKASGFRAEGFRVEGLEAIYIQGLVLQVGNFQSALLRTPKRAPALVGAVSTGHERLAI